MKNYTGEEQFTSRGIARDFSLSDFWRWQASDLLSGTTRGVLAEFLVASALGINDGIHGFSFMPYDLLFKNGEKEWKLEIKSSAYLQTEQALAKGEGLSAIKFSIRPTREYVQGGENNEFPYPPKRQSDMYIFCIFIAKDRATADPLNLDLWCFYPVKTSTLDEAFGDRKTLSFAALQSLNCGCYDYESLRDGVLWQLDNDLKTRERVIRHNALKSNNALP
jgi:hypothetical protein